MGLFKALKAVKQAAALGTPDGHAPRGALGAMEGLASTMAGIMTPMLLAIAPERGQPLPATEPEALAAGDPTALAAGQAAIRARDSAFDPGLLTAFADQVFVAMVGVWATSDPAPARGVLADSLWDPLAATTSLNQAMNRPGHESMGLAALAAMQTGRATMAGAHAGQWYDTVNFTVDVILGEEAPPMARVPWKEEWLYQRSVQPGGDPMAMPERCPSCGASTTVDAAGACTSCRQPVPVCTAGWLVSRIVSHNPFIEEQYAEMITADASEPGTGPAPPPRIAGPASPDLRGAATTLP